VGLKTGLVIRGWARRLGLAMSAVAVVVAVTLLAARPHAWPWLVPISVLLVAGIPTGFTALGKLYQRRVDAAKVARKVLQGVTSNALPLVKEATDLDAHVARAVLPIPYIHRDVEDEARRCLSSGRPLLLVGSSMVGKTHMAVVLVRDMFPEYGVMIPDKMEALTALDAADVALRRSVIFLDDIDRLIGGGGITEGAIRRLAACGNVIIGTIRAASYDRYRPTDKLRPPEWELINTFERIFIDRNLSSEEQDRLAKAVPDSNIQERILRVGLGEYAGAAEQIAETLRLGPSVNNIGYALVLGVADWRRSGIDKPTPAKLLSALAIPHLDARGTVNLSHEQTFQAALEWATREINPTVSLLQISENDTYVIYDYALDLISEHAKPIADPTWQTAIQFGTPSDLMKIASAALSKANRRRDIAIEAFRLAASSEGFDRKDWAVFGLAIFLDREGDTVAAQSAYEQAVQSKDDLVRNGAHMYLASLLRDKGDLAGARKNYQEVVDSGFEEAPFALYKLGEVLSDDGDVEGARAAYEQAIKLADTEASPLSAFRLGFLLYGQGDIVGALKAFDIAISSGHSEASPAAAFNRGIVLTEQGNTSEAREAYLQASRSEDAKLAYAALINLAKILAQEGDIIGAEKVYRQVIKSDHIDNSPAAALQLGLLLAQREVAGAKEAYQLAIDSGHSEYAPRAATCLGTLLAEQGDLTGARSAYQYTIDSGNHEFASIAAVNLAELLEAQGDMAGTEEVYKWIVENGHGDDVPSAMVNLGVLLDHRGESADALKLFRRAIAPGHSEPLPIAALNIGAILGEQGDMRGAQEAYQLAINSRHEEAAPAAAFNLGLLLKEQMDLMGASAALQIAIDSDHPYHSAIASVSLANILVDQGDTLKAREIYQRIIASEHSAAAPLAALNLGQLLNDQGDTEGARDAYEVVIASGNVDYLDTAMERLEELR
jgi:tetratricopeptide (TPR) repeat protein